jgi:hypothetical protein
MSALLAAEQEPSGSTRATTDKGVHNPRGKLIAPESIEGLRMTFRDYICYESVFLFWPDAKYTSVSMALPTCHSYLEMHTEAGKYEWHVIDSRHAYLVFGPSEDKQQVYKFTFDTPTHAKGYLPEDARPYTFKFDKP